MIEDNLLKVIKEKALTDFFEEELIPFEVLHTYVLVHKDMITKLQMFYLGRLCSQFDIGLELIDQNEWHLLTE